MREVWITCGDVELFAVEDGAGPALDGYEPDENPQEIASHFVELLYLLTQGQDGSVLSWRLLTELLPISSEFLQPTYAGLGDAVHAAPK